MPFLLITFCARFIYQLPSQCYADDLKFLADVSVHSSEIVQNEISIVASWVDEKGVPLSLEKCSVLHCGPHQPSHVYYIKSTQIDNIDSIKDLGVKRSSDSTYSANCNHIIAKVKRACGTMTRAFRSGHRKLLWPPFTTYVLPIMTYCSPVWSLYFKSDITALESVQ